MSTLTWFYSVILQSCFNYEFSSTYMRPFNRDTQPGIVAAPSAGAYKYIRPAHSQELLIDSFDFICNTAVVGCRIVVCLNIQNILYIINYTATDCIVASNDTILIINF